MQVCEISMLKGIRRCDPLTWGISQHLLEEIDTVFIQLVLEGSPELLRLPFGKGGEVVRER